MREVTSSKSYSCIGIVVEQGRSTESIWDASCAKEGDIVKVSMIQMLGGAIIYVLNIIMHRMHRITRLLTQCEVLFDHRLFGSFATEKIARERSTRYARKNLFLP
jgi:hypothetical protein